MSVISSAWLSSYTQNKSHKIREVSQKRVYNTHMVNRINILVPSVVKMRRSKTPIMRSLPEALSNFAMSDALYYTGKIVILFTMFYSSLNLVFYRKLRKEHDKENKDKTK